MYVVSNNYYKKLFGWKAEKKYLIMNYVAWTGQKGPFLALSYIHLVKNTI